MLRSSFRLTIMVSMILLALTLSASAARQLASSSIFSRIASPTVVESWMSYQDDVAENPTTLLVLWRGTPGWFERGPIGSDSGGGGVSGGRGTPRRSNAYAYISMGGFTLVVETDYANKSVKILNEEISLETNNVVLVDFVDSVNGPTIVGQRWIDTPLRSASTPDPTIDIIKRTPDLFEYLGCNLSLPNSPKDAVIRTSCEQMQP